MANLSRRRAESLIQIVAFGTGIMVLLLLGLVRNDLANDWRISLPDNLPNYFFINIPTSDRDAFMRCARGARRDASRVLPMIRGRMTAINGRAVEGMRFGGAGGRGQRQRASRIFRGLRSWGPTTASSTGKWWGPQDAGKPLVSLATEFQESLQREAR